MKSVFTNGCFDILHRGHIELLSHCRYLGGVNGRVTVGINSDDSVRRLKGPARPVVSQEDRKVLLEALRCVDEVIIFDAETPYSLIQQLKPDVIVKGGDYQTKDVVGNDLAKVVIFNFVKGYSTTATCKKINSLEKTHDKD